MQKVKITYVGEKKSEHGPYTRVGFRTDGSDNTTFVNIDGHGHGLVVGQEVLWDPEKRRFSPLAEEKRPAENGERIARTSALYAAVQVHAAGIQAGLVPMDKDPVPEILRMAKAFEAYILGG